MSKIVSRPAPPPLNIFMQCQYLGQYFLYLPASVARWSLSDCLLPELEAADSMPVDSTPADYMAGYWHIRREADSTVGLLEHPVTTRH